LPDSSRLRAGLL